MYFRSLGKKEVELNHIDLEDAIGIPHQDIWYATQLPIYDTSEIVSWCNGGFRNLYMIGLF